MRRLSMLLLCLVGSPGVLLAQGDPPFASGALFDVQADANGDCQADVADDAVCTSGNYVAWEHSGARGAGFIVTISSRCGLGIFITHTQGPIQAVCGRVSTLNGLDEIVDKPAAERMPGPEVTALDNDPFPSPRTEIRAWGAVKPLFPENR